MNLALKAVAIIIVLLFVVRIGRVVGLELGVDLGVGEDVAAGDAVFVGAVAPAVGVGVCVSASNG